MSPNFSFSLSSLRRSFPSFVPSLSLSLSLPSRAQSPRLLWQVVSSVRLHRKEGTEEEEVSPLFLYTIDLECLLAFSYPPLLLLRRPHETARRRARLWMRKKSRAPLLFPLESSLPQPFSWYMCEQSLGSEGEPERFFLRGRSTCDRAPLFKCIRKSEGRKASLARKAYIPYTSTLLLLPRSIVQQGTPVVNNL